MLLLISYTVVLREPRQTFGDKFDVMSSNHVGISAVDHTEMLPVRGTTSSGDSQRNDGKRIAGFLQRTQLLGRSVLLAQFGRNSFIWVTSLLAPTLGRLSRARSRGPAGWRRRLVYPIAIRLRIMPIGSVGR